MEITSYLLGKKAGGGGGTVNLQNKDVTVNANGTQDITADSGYDGLQQVNITTNVQPNLQSKSETITTNTTTTITADTGYDGLSSVAVTTNVSGSGVPDWSQIGYSSTPQSIINDFNYSKNIYDNWTPTTSLYKKYQNDKSLVYMPLVDTSTTTDMISTFDGCTRLVSVPLLNTSNNQYLQNAFYSCGSLVEIPVLDTSKVKNMASCFYGCLALNDQSLDNILQMCINTTAEYQRAKTLAQLGITNSTLTAKVPNLPHYQDFINAGWTIN